ncbi:MAG: amino acid adenylation domain-containing protein, partial [Vicinamibacterales bacterium]
MTGEPVRTDVGQGYRLSPQQARAWSLRTTTAGDPYRTTARMILRGKVDLERLRSAIDAVIARHEILRTVFHEVPVARTVVQSISPSGDARALEYRLTQLAANEHELVVDMPALCADAKSVQILADEIARAYGGLHEDDDLIQYADLAEWANQLIEAEAAEPARAFWRDAARAGGDERLPFERVADPQHYAPAIVEGSDAALAYAGVDAAARRLDVSLEDLLAAAWLALLRRVTARDTRVALVADGRSYRELERAIGAFSRLLPVHCPIDDSDSFETVARRWSLAARDAVRFQHYYAGAGEAGFAFEYRSGVPETPPGELSISVSDVTSRAERVKVRLFCEVRGDRIVPSIDYDSARFGEPDIRGLFRLWHDLLASAVTHAEHAVAELSMAGEWRPRSAGAPSPYPRDRCLHEAFADQAARTPGAVALIENDRRLTYTELDDRSNRLAHRLRRLGARPECLVALLMERSIDMVVATLAVLEAGAAYVPLDPANPRDRVARMLDTLEPVVVLTDASCAAQVPAGVPAIVLAQTDVASEPGDDEPIESGATPDNLAYVMFTSGSTGVPKGVTIAHRQVMNYLWWAKGTYAGAGRGAPLHSSIGFDLSVTSLFVPLLSGTPVTLLPREPSLEDLARELSEGGFSFVKLTPGHLEALRHAVSPRQVSHAARIFVVGGDVADPRRLEPWRRLVPGATIVNEYGPTETTVGCCVYSLPHGAPMPERVPIGRPIANSRMYVLDAALQPVPPWVPGEIYIGGDGVGRGYLHDAALTAVRFVPDPFVDRPGARMYRSGDRGRYLPDGDIEFLGRQDRQVKIRGYRVELDEIEAALRLHPSLSHAFVLLRDAGAEREVEAYVALEPDATVDVSSLREFLAVRVPPYMVPARFFAVDRVPLDAHGKPDRRALQALRSRPLSPEGPVSAAHTTEEEVLCGIWSRVLEVERVSPDASYFDLGGDSIRAIQIMALAQGAGIAFSLDQLFRSRTVRALAADIRRTMREAAPPRTAPFSLLSADDRRLVPPGVEDVYPMTRLQAGMLYHRDARPESAIYHDVSSFHLRASLERDTLDAAIEALLARHPVLRTSFDLASFGEPMQLVHVDVPLPLAVEDLTALDPTAQQEAIDAWIEAEKQRDFDVARPPLVRFQVHLRSAETLQFSVSFHHAVLDGWSDATMLSELMLDYTERRRSSASSLTAPASTFRDYVALEQQAVASGECRDYWTRELRGTGAACVRLGREAVGPRRMRTLAVPVSEATSTGLKTLATEAMAPLKSVLVAAHARVLSVVSGAAEIITCISTSGRPESPDGDRVLGLFLNSAPMRLAPGDTSWVALAATAFRKEREALPHRRYPLAEIKRDLGAAAVPDSAFYFTHYHIYQRLRAQTGYEVLQHQVYEETSFALVANFGLNPFSQRVYLNLTFDESSFSRDEVESIARLYRRVLDAAAARPDARFSSAGLLDDDERRWLVEECNRTAVDFGPFQPVQELWAAQAARTPARAAIRSAAGEVSYAGLDARVTHIAQALQARGARPECLVAILAERSLGLVVTVLATLKSGAAYLALSATDPPARLRQVLESARPRLVLVQDSLRARVPSGIEGVVSIEEVASAGSAVGGAFPAVHPEHLAYVAFTSGSTGAPKGIMISHGALSNYLRWALATYDFDEAGVVPLHTSIAFDLTVTSLFCPLLSGQTIAIVGEEHGAEGLGLALQ